MADILEHPKFGSNGEQVWDFPCGAQVILKEGEDNPLTVAHAVYLLENVKFQILTMMMIKD
jgi:hypothetical protein